MYEKLAKYRLPYSYLIAAVSIAFAHKPVIYYGFILVAIGMALRFWAAGYIHKNAEVSTGGPYALTRNPLYLGSFMGALGAFILGHEFWPLVFFVCTYVFFYGSLIRSEEKFLSSHYGDDFSKYKANVPVFLPRLIPYKSESTSSFSWAKALDNKEHKYSATAILVPILVLVVAYLRG